MRALLPLCIASALIACDAADVIPGDPDRGLTGMDASIDGGMDSGRDARIPYAPPEAWIATKTTLDVWWPGIPVHDPGRGDIEVYTLTRATGACGDDRYEATVKVCGIVLPPYTSDVVCKAYQLDIPDSTWDSLSMPTFTARSNYDVDAGGAVAKSVTALVGIDLPHGTAWPTAGTVQALTCDDSTGAACFPDHDEDLSPGITAHARTDDAIYTGPYDDGLCTVGRPYRFHGLATGINIWGHDPFIPQADHVRLGLRAKLGVVDALGEACAIDDYLVAPRFDLRAVSCSVDPTKLRQGGSYAPPRDPRLDSMDFTCTDPEAVFIDETLPQYRVLAAGESPGDSRRPNGWFYGDRDRDIDMRMSEGSRSTTVILGDDFDAGTDGTPSCAQVRAAFRGL